MLKFSIGKQEKEEATAQKMQLLEYMGQEKTIETLLRNKGLPESFVVITESGVNVTVNSEELDQSMVTKICDIVMRETGRKQVRSSYRTRRDRIPDIGVTTFTASRLQFRYRRLGSATSGSPEKAEEYTEKSKGCKYSAKYIVKRIKRICHLEIHSI